MRTGPAISWDSPAEQKGVQTQFMAFGGSLWGAEDKDMYSDYSGQGADQQQKGLPKWSCFEESINYSLFAHH